MLKGMSDTEVNLVENHTVRRRSQIKAISPYYWCVDVHTIASVFTDTFSCITW